LGESRVLEAMSLMATPRILQASTTRQMPDAPYRGGFGSGLPQKPKLLKVVLEEGARSEVMSVMATTPRRSGCGGRRCPLITAPRKHPKRIGGHSWKATAVPGFRNLQLQL
jgi:hypothetical protein